jgi:hypothetical protein
MTLVLNNNTSGHCEVLRVANNGRPIGVDRAKGIIHGYVIAQEGPFKSEGRGEFDNKSLDIIQQLAKAIPEGLRSRLGHPPEGEDGVGKYLGRVKDPWQDTTTTPEGKQVKCVRGDLCFNPAAHKTPHGDLADYIMTAVENDPGALSTSLVLSTEMEYRIDPQTRRPAIDDDGAELAPLWRPTALHGTDVCFEGDAVDGLLARLSKSFDDDGVELDDGDNAPGSPDQPESDTNNPYNDDSRGIGMSAHDGCRSTLAYHHLTLCRLCNGEMSACGCDNRDNESRVITMSKEPCATCKLKAEQDPEDKGDIDPIVPDVGENDPSNPENTLLHRSRYLDLLNLFE